MNRCATKPSSSIEPVLGCAPKGRLSIFDIIFQILIALPFCTQLAQGIPATELDPPPPEPISIQTQRTQIQTELIAKNAENAHQTISKSKLQFPNESWTNEELALALLRNDRPKALSLAKTLGTESVLWISNIAMHNSNIPFIELARTTAKLGNCSEAIPLLEKALEREPFHWDLSLWLATCAIEMTNVSLCKKVTRELKPVYESAPEWIALSRICEIIEPGFRPISTPLEPLRNQLPPIWADAVIAHFIHKLFVSNTTVAQTVNRIEQVATLLPNEIQSLSILIVQLARSETNASMTRPCALLKSRWDRSLPHSNQIHPDARIKRILSRISASEEARLLCAKK